MCVVVVAFFRSQFGVCVCVSVCRFVVSSVNSVKEKEIWRLLCYSYRVIVVCRNESNLQELRIWKMFDLFPTLFYSLYWLYCLRALRLSMHWAIRPKKMMKQKKNYNNTKGYHRFYFYFFLIFEKKKEKSTQK